MYNFISETSPKKFIFANIILIWHSENKKELSIFVKFEVRYGENKRGGKVSCLWMKLKKYFIYF